MRAWMMVALVACAGSGKDDDGTDEGLTEEAYGDAILDAACDAAVDCNASVDIIEAFCEPEEVTATTDSGCTFDAEYAQDCIDGTWTCDSAGGLTFPVPPSVCGLVYDCPDVTGDDDDDTSGDDDDDDTTLAQEIDDASLADAVTCSGSKVTFEIAFLGDASYGLFDAADTVNYDTIYGNWNDTHTLDAARIGTGITDLEATISTGSSLADWSDGVATIFICSYHYDARDTMSYAVRAYDLNGDLADCVAWGEDPQGFIDNEAPNGSEYAYYNPRPAESDFAACRVASAAR